MSQNVAICRIQKNFDFPMHRPRRRPCDKMRQFETPGEKMLHRVAHRLPAGDAGRGSLSDPFGCHAHGFA